MAEKKGERRLTGRESEAASEGVWVGLAVLDVNVKTEPRGSGRK
jgi:hypothetical protein